MDMCITLRTLRIENDDTAVVQSGGGIVAEALRELIRFFFEETGCNRVVAGHDVRNPNSGKVMVKCGMRYEGTRRQGSRSNQGLGDTAFYAILREDWSV